MDTKNVIETIGALMFESLGSSDVVKCIESEGQHCYVSCAASMLSNLQIEHPVGQVVTSLLTSHHNRHGCCSRTLVAHLMLWHQEALTCLDMGIPAHAIVKYMHQALESCVEYLQKKSISLQQVQLDLQQGLDGSQSPAYTQLTKPTTTGHKIIVSQEAVIDDSQSNEEKGHSNQSDEFKQSGSHLEKTLQKSVCRELHTTNDVNSPVINKCDALLDEEEEEDISWFFDGGQIPAAPSMDEDAVRNLEKVTDILDTFSASTDKDYKSKNNDCGLDIHTQFKRESCHYSVNHRSHERSQIRKIHEFSQNRHESEINMADQNVTSVDDEFDSCSNDIDWRDTSALKSEDFKSHSAFLGSSEKKESFLSSAHDNRISSLCPVQAEEDEFDSCFDNINFQNNHVKTNLDIGKSLSSKSFKKEILSLDRIANDVFKVESVQRTRFDENDRNEESLEDKIKKILDKKTANKTKAITNQSRHFKTIASSVDNLHGDKNGNNDDPNAGNNDLLIKHKQEVKNLKPKFDKEERTDEFSKITQKSVLDRKSFLNESGILSSELISPFLPHEAKLSISNSQKMKSDLYNLSRRDNDSVEKSHNTNSKIQANKEVLSSPLMVSVSNPSENISDMLSSVVTKNVKERGKLKLSQLQLHSRHFNKSKHTMQLSSQNSELSNVDTIESAKDRIENQSYIHQKNGYDDSECNFSHLLGKLGNRLSHGRQREMRLVMEIAKAQSAGCHVLEDLCFEVSRVHSVCIHGPSQEQSTVVSGVVVKTTSSQMSLIQQHDAENGHVIMLINGDISDKFHHKGYIQNTSVHCVSRSLSTDEPSLTTEFIHIMNKLGVSLLFVSGSVAPPVIDLCIAHNIVVLEHVSYKALTEISLATRADILTYVQDADEVSLGHGVRVQTWSCDWMDQVEETESRCYVSVMLPHLSQTAVLTHPSKEMLPVIEEHFWHCASRLRSVLQSGCVVTGCGYAEMECVRHILTHADQASTEDSKQDSTHIFKSLVYEAFSKGFERFTNQVQRNICVDRDLSTKLSPPSTDFSPKSGIEMSVEYLRHCNISDDANEHVYGCDQHGEEVYDDVTAKVDAWRTALHLVTILMQTDLHIVTGGDHQLSSHVL